MGNIPELVTYNSSGPSEIVMTSIPMYTEHSNRSHVQ